ncbi:glycosyltransferase [Polaribacter litorisediminis]|uniref:glycosyltransferase n=1 Tax=Polaribacter litorisediminis TaxID=1908341 RepID=UPI001CBBF60A|nr:glycosyltransferase [Polaribacter litorisediminis]UAM97192.1 glycosyltransferase [Polaribacter litorisediminis]
MVKKNIVISGINLFEGGTLSIIKDCLTFLNTSNYVKNYNFIALVHKNSLFDTREYMNIRFIEFPKSRKSYFYRLYYEYIYFNKLAKEHQVFFWLSLHDMTPNVGTIPQAVYCHNVTPFNTVNLSDIYLQPVQFFFRLFYKYLYQINIKRNKFVIVQQLWIKHQFKEMFGLKENQIITAPPEITKITQRFLEKSNIEIAKKEPTRKVFFFPTFPRTFKNIEVICKAMELMSKLKNIDINVMITIDGSENKYAKTIVEKYQHIKTLKFIGLIKREEVYEYYSKCDGLIFPSKLESWGLPLSEFKQFNKPMFVSNLPYAKETVGHYDFVCFFNPDDAVQLSKLFINAAKNKLLFHETKAVQYEQPFVKGWNELFALLIK